MYKNNNITYRLEIQGRDLNIFTITDLTIDFDIERNYCGSTNTGNFTIYNLQKDTRNSIKKTPLTKEYTGDYNYRSLSLYAGYDNQLYPLFIGSVKECGSYRSGADFVTKISGWVGGEAMRYSHTNTAIKGDINILEQLSKDMSKYIDIGYISEKAKYILKSGSRGFTLEGKTWDLIIKYQKDLEIFIDNEKLYIYSKDEWNEKKVFINNQTGLLNTPIDYGVKIEVKTIGEPIINLKDRIEINVEEDTEYNGEYGVIGIKHNGTFANYGNKATWITTISMQK